MEERAEGRPSLVAERLEGDTPRRLRVVRYRIVRRGRFAGLHLEREGQTTPEVYPGLFAGHGDAMVVARTLSALEPPELRSWISDAALALRSGGVGKESIGRWIGALAQASGVVLCFPQDGGEPLRLNGAAPSGAWLCAVQAPEEGFTSELAARVALARALP